MDELKKLKFCDVFAVLANLHFEPVSDNRIKQAADYADEWRAQSFCLQSFQFSVRES